MGPRLRGPRDAGVAGCPSRGRPDGGTLASFGQKAARALLRLRMGERVRKCGSSLNRSLESQLTMSNSPTRSRGAFLRPGFCILASLTPNRGVGGAPRNVRVRARHPWGVSCASQTRVNALMTRYARRLARRLASHNAGRSPLGAPPWRFFTRGRASVSGMTRIRSASSSQPGRSAWRATSRASRGKRLRSRRRRTPRLAPPSGSPLEDALDERGWEPS